MKTKVVEKQDEKTQKHKECHIVVGAGPEALCGYRCSYVENTFTLSNVTCVICLELNEVYFGNE